MKAITKLLAGGVAIAALASAAPAAAQYFPGYGSPYGSNPYGYNPYGNSQYGYGMDRQSVINQCAGVVQARLGGGYGNSAARVLGISRVEQRENGGMLVRGVASSGRYAGYGYGQGQAQPDLVWSCRTDFRGAVVDVDVNAAQRTHGGHYQNYNYTPWNNDYSQYGYQRY